MTDADRTGSRRGRARARTVKVCLAASAVLLMEASLFAAPALAVGERIRDIQGQAHRSPLVGNSVIDVPGVITAFRDFGFFFQDDAPDSDPATSEGIFVFTGSTSEPVNTFAVGDRVLVDGTVAEFRPGNVAENLSETQITSSVSQVTRPDPPGAATIPATVIGNGGRVPPTTIIDNDTTGGDVEGTSTFDPEQDGIDFYESLEGMLVQVNSAVVVGPADRQQQFGEFPVLPDGGTLAGDDRTFRGGITIAADDFNPERIIFDDEVLTDNGQVTPPPANVGDRYNEPLFGVVSYSFGNFKAQFINSPGTLNTEPGREITDVTPRAGELAVATWSLENLSPEEEEGNSSFVDSAREIVTNLRSPDLITLTEIQDSNGDVNDGRTDADVTSQRLIDAIVAAGGPRYEYRDIDPVNGQDGGEPGGNIRVAFLFHTQRGLAFVDRPGGGPTTDTTVSPGPTGPQLSSSPGRVDPTAAAFNDSRKPLAGEFTFGGQTLIVVANHFTSKGPDTPLFGRFQPPQLNSEPQRRQQAQIVNRFADEVLAADPNARLIVLGDVNDFEFSPPLADLKEGGVLTNLIDGLPRQDRYTFVFDGNSQTLDHILVSGSLAVTNPQFDIVHSTAEFIDRRSDHDPLVARINLSGAPSPVIPESPMAALLPLAAVALLLGAMVLRPRLLHR